ncbi:MAG: ABC transporter ATP-binding protein [Deltaproteobacteria bacterium]|nr:ABC transporter ATP-binding protein [Deltaproteobacteria bacterium]
MKANDQGAEFNLKIDRLTLRFGGVTALINVSFEVNRPEILAIIGPNGAGKTSLLNCISGFYRPQEGDVYLNGEKITMLAPYKRAKLGVSRTFQNMQLYAGLSTLDNLMAARHIHMNQKITTSAIYFGWARRKEIKHREIVEDIIDFLEIESIRHKTVGSLAYGQRKQVDLARALALEPKLLLLDEPMAGLNVEEKEDMARFIIDVYELKKIPVVLVEHDMGVVMDICDRILVLDFGRKVAEGLPDEIKTNPEVINVYLG